MKNKIILIEEIGGLKCLKEKEVKLVQETKIYVNKEGFLSVTPVKKRTTREKNKIDI